jgi:protein ImuA
MSTRIRTPVLEALRQRLQGLDGGARRRRAALPFGVAAIDARLPDGGLALGALHEVAGGGNGVIDGAAAALFAAGIAARTRGRVLWCVTRQDLFAPALAAAGLAPDRVIYVEAGDEKTVLACFEEGLREHSGLGSVVAEVAWLSMTASRRLQLAAEGSGAIGVAIRRLSSFFRTQGRGGEKEFPANFAHPTAAVTRWRVSALPSVPLPVAGVGRARWRLELIRCRGGEAACFDVEACDAQGRLAVPADLVHGPGQEATGQQRAAR